MSTQTMRAPPRRVSASNKRKEREGFDSVKPSTPTAATPNKVLKPIHQLGSPKLHDENMASNQLLAGYLAHEYLTRGTLFGKHWEPDQAEAETGEPNKGAGEADQQQYQRYVEVSGLLKENGAHLPGIVNPCQLSGIFHM